MSENDFLEWCGGRTGLEQLCLEAERPMRKPGPQGILVGVVQCARMSAWEKHTGQNQAHSWLPSHSGMELGQSRGKSALSNLYGSSFPNISLFPSLYMNQLLGLVRCLSHLGFYNSATGRVAYKQLKCVSQS